MYLYPRAFCFSRLYAWLLGVLLCAAVGVIYLGPLGWVISAWWWRRRRPSARDVVYLDWARLEDYWIADRALCIRYHGPPFNLDPHAPRHLWLFADEFAPAQWAHLRRQLHAQLPQATLGIH